MRIKTLHFLFLLAAGLTFSCNLSDDQKDTIVNVDPEFYIHLFESLGDTPQFQFHLETFEEHTCLNSVINNSMVASYPNLTLFIKDVETLSDCNPGIAPATGIATAGRLLPGTYNLLISLKNAVESTGQLTVLADRYVIQMDTKNGIEIIEKNLNRIPAKTVWGYVAFDDPAAVGDEPANFLNEMADLLVPNSLPNGYFGHFSIANNELTELRTPPNRAHIQTFLLKAETDLSGVQALVNNYRNGSAGSQMSIKVYTWDGKVF